MPISKQIISPYLIAQIESLGHEVEKHKIRNIIASIKRINPLEKLKDKGYLTPEEYKAGLKYQRCLALSQLSHHSRPNYNDIPLSSIQYSAGDRLDDIQLDADKFVAKVKQAIDSADKKILLERIRGRKSRGAKLNHILKLVFECEIQLKLVKNLFKIHNTTLEDRIKKICQIIKKIS